MIQQNHTLEEFMELEIQRVVEIQRVEKRLHIIIDRTGGNVDE